MQINQLFTKKSSWLLPLVIAVCSMLIISSCGKQEEKAPDGTCITLSRAKINNAWGKPGHLKDISYLTFITSYNPVNHKFEVSVQAYKADYSAIGDLVKLAVGKSCPTNLPPILIGVNNQDFLALNIVDTTTTPWKLKDFTYIDFTPVVDKLSCGTYNLNLLKYKTSVEGGGEGIPKIDIITLPCPPCINCRPVCEDYDSTITLPPPPPAPVDTSHM